MVFLPALQKNRTVILTLLGFFIVAMMLRTYRLTDRIRWWSDIPRDFLVSRHLAFYDEHLINGHSASGVWTIDPSTGNSKMLNYPPYYYYYLAFLWKTIGSVEGIVFVNIIWHCLAIFPLYGTLQLLHRDKQASLLSSLLFAISAFTVSNSHIHLTHHFTVPFVMAGVYLFTLGWKHKNWWVSLGAILFLTFISSIQYSLIVLIGLLCLAWIIRAVIEKKSQILLGSIALTLNSFFFFLLIHLNQLKYFGFWTFLKPFFHTNSIEAFQHTPLLALIKERILDSRLEFFRLGHSPVSYFFVFSMLVLFFILNFASWKTRFAWPIRFISFTIFLYYLLVVSKADSFVSSYLLYSDYAWIYLISFIIPVLSLYYKTFGKTAGIIIIGWCIIILSTSFSYLRENEIYNDYTTAKTTAQYILDRYPANVFFRIGSYYSMRIEDGTVGYWLEVLSGQKLYYLVSEDRNYEFIQPDMRTYILLCRKYYMQEAIDKGFCAPPENYELISTTDFPDHVMYEYNQKSQ